MTVGEFYGIIKYRKRKKEKKRKKRGGEMVKINSSYVCFYCGTEYEKPEDVLKCQKRHEKDMEKANTEILNGYITHTLLDISKISDGRNTFQELYEDKYTLVLSVLTLMSQLDGVEVWYTDRFSDGSSRKGFILVGTNYEADDQITFLVPEEMRGFFEVIGKELDIAPPFRGHTSKEVSFRLYQQIIVPILKAR